MKKSNVEFERRLEQARWAQRLEERRRKKLRKSHRTNPFKKRHPRAPGRAWKKPPPIEIDMAVPEALCLRTKHRETCKFVKSLRAEGRAGKRVNLIFSDVEKITTSALTYLLAQIHKLRFEYGEDQINGTYPSSTRVEQLLTRSGFFDLLNVRSRIEADPSNKVMRYIKFKSDQQPNGSAIRLLREELLGADLKMPVAVRQRVFRALTEAMTNVQHHAYVTKPNLTPPVAHRWWLLATLNGLSKKFTLVFYDAGVGIPKTLPRRYPMEHIRAIFSMLPILDPDDGQMISAAMVLGRTCTALDNRGKGLLDLTRLIDHVNAGSMRIFSRHGRYTYTGGTGTATNSSEFVEGTLIEWQLPIDVALDLPSEDQHASAVIDS
jgi:hypothetical protein